MPQVIRAVTRNAFNFDNVAASSAVGVPLAPRIGVAAFKDIVLAVKTYDLDIGTDALLEIIAFPDASTDWDLIVGISTPLATVTLDANTNTNLNLDALDQTQLPAMVAIWIQATQPASAQTIQAELEVDLIMREQ